MMYYAPLLGAEQIERIPDDIRSEVRRLHYLALIAMRFWPRVSERSREKCWEWTGRRIAGYGVLGLHCPEYPQSVLAHRAAWELMRGPIAQDMTLDHLSLNKGCVNPLHLEVVSRGENARRFMLARARCKRGHEFTPENTRITTKGRRACRACDRDRCAAERATGTRTQ